MNHLHSIGLAAAILASPPCVFAQASQAFVENLAWLSGCWERTGPGFSIQEQWMDPRGHMMVGMSRTVVKGETLEYEYLRIEERDGKLVYVAGPSGQEEASFPQVELTDSLVIFVNPEHDFPQRISYRRLADGSLLAEIAGPIGGEEKVVDFPMRRVPCE
jgi:hypothetical protein